MTAVTHFALARPYRLEPRQLSPGSPACIPSWCAAWSPSACSRSPATPQGRLWFDPSQVQADGPDPAAARWA